MVPENTAREWRSLPGLAGEQPGRSPQAMAGACQSLLPSANRYANSPPPAVGRFSRHHVGAEEVESGT